MSDAPKPLKKDDPLDVAAVERTLRARLPDLPQPFSLQRFSGGASNLTYLARFGDRELVLRAPPPGASTLKSGAHDMEREHRILSRLRPHYPKAPRVVCLVDAADSPFGGAFFAMERVPGRVLRGHEALDPASMARASAALVDGLVELHAIDLERAGLADIGKPQGYLERQVSMWADRYEKARTDDVAEMDRLAPWLKANVPTTTRRPAFVHNDYKYDNLVLDPDDAGVVRAVLDWELSTVGDPIMDLGTTLAYWVDATDADEVQQLPFGPTAAPGNLTRAEVVRRYAEKSGRAVDDVLFAYVASTFKVAVIAQQIYFRWAKGFAKDDRFALMIVGVKVLAARAARALDAGRIDAP
jgi:aminoglycoside phosphotransferase (APT) family kinase protein